MTSISIKPSGQACGAEISGVDLSNPLGAETISAIRSAWMEHHVLSFPNQKLNDDQFEAFALQFGSFGKDPYFAPIPGRTYIAAIRREAEDTSPIFAEQWHSDWSFLATPPTGTLLYSLDIPPCGGDTLFANQHLALEKMPEELKAKFAGKNGIHSAALAYSPKGVFAEEGKKGSMDILVSESAYERHTHPIVRPHPETGEPGIFGTGFAYIVGIEGMDDQEARPLLKELYEWQDREEFTYRHKWQKDMLVMWDNRSVLHRATGGYEGYRRELHRITLY